MAEYRLSAPAEAQIDEILALDHQFFDAVAVAAQCAIVQRVVAQNCRGSQHQNMQSCSIKTLQSRSQSVPAAAADADWQ
ncbi:hypothetical protein [Allomesorhizobium camelthorni]|uniref:Uncharacterized protein n=1 Tax=Allomesorhizobium camelthorni TaxID=475069 RepID=A0A6G4WDT8_9HYPH|nr:hypothetical protein [Mesorhizobium camelthorni]NGO52921.1 hypothetical protein [Mesorhizobium camelthorni]